MQMKLTEAEQDIEQRHEESAPANPCCCCD